MTEIALSSYQHPSVSLRDPIGLLCVGNADVARLISLVVAEAEEKETACDCGLEHIDLHEGTCDGPRAKETFWIVSSEEQRASGCSEGCEDAVAAHGGHGRGRSLSSFLATICLLL